MERSWYNRGGVERVMGYCTDEQYRRLLERVPPVEKKLADEGIIPVRFWFFVSDKVQEKRFRSRLEDPISRWKLSETDLFSITRWEDCW